MSYFDEVTRSMTWLGKQPDTVFIGQSVAYPGNAIYKTLSGVPMGKHIELPVAEEMQMGMSIGISLTGKTVISIYPRFDFLLCAMNQLVNHLDKLQDFTHGQYKVKVIVRVTVGSTKPMYPGVQHCGDYEKGLREILNNMAVYRLNDSEKVMETYQSIYYGSQSAMVIEEGDKYNG